MPRSKIVVYAGAGTVLLIVLFAVAVLLFVQSDTYRHQVEERLADAMGLEVSVGAPIALAFLPGLYATLEDVQVRNEGLEIASAGKATVGIRLLSLLRGHVSIDSIYLHDVGFFVRRDQDGRFNFQSDRQQDGPETVLEMTRFTVLNARLRFEGDEPWRAFQATACNLHVRDLYVSNAEQKAFTQGLAFTGELRCGEFESEALTLADVAFSLNADAEVLAFEPITLQMFDANATARVAVDVSGAVPQWSARLSLSGFPIEAFFRTLSPEKVAAGSMDFSMRVSMQGSTLDELTQTMAGQVSLRGSDLTLYGTDLDEEFSRLESSRNFNLVDVGALFLAGPVGLVVTRGYEVANLLQGSGGVSEVRHLVSDWRIEGGIMRAQDVAMATVQNRVALQGALDFVNQDFDDVVVALLDSNGCVEVQQKVQGTFAEPVVALPSVLASLAGPALELVKQGQDLLSGDDCETFYSGSVVVPTGTASLGAVVASPQ